MTIIAGDVTTRKSYNRPPAIPYDGYVEDLHKLIAEEKAERKEAEPLPPVQPVHYTYYPDEETGVFDGLVRAVILVSLGIIAVVFGLPMLFLRLSGALVNRVFRV
jgi:hypothetical protein